MKKILLLLLALTLLSCLGRSDENLQTQREGIVPKKEPEESLEIVIPATATIETTLDVAEKAIFPIWEQTVDLLDGEVKELVVFNDHIYVFGDQFGVKGYEEEYKKYQAGNGESIYYYIEARNYTRSFDSFIRSYSLKGEIKKTEVLDFAVLDSLHDLSPIQEGILFSVISSPNSLGGDNVVTAGIVQKDGITLFQQSLLKDNRFQFVADFLFVYFGDLNAMTHTTNLYGYRNSDFYLIAENTPAVSYGYKINKELWGIDTYYRKIEYFVIGEELNHTINVSFENPIFEKIQVGNLKLSSERVYQFGYLNRLRNYTGFYWTAYDHGTNPVFHYFNSDDSILFTNLYVVEDGFFITGKEDGKMLLVFLNPEGEILWKSHIRDGVLRGIVKQDGRFFVAGDYNARVSDKDGDWGVDYLYLAEINIP